MLYGPSAVCEKMYWKMEGSASPERASVNAARVVRTHMLTATGPFLPYGTVFICTVLRTVLSQRMTLPQRASRTHVALTRVPEP